MIRNYAPADRDRLLELHAQQVAKFGLEAIPAFVDPDDPLTVRTVVYEDDGVVWGAMTARLVPEVALIGGVDAPFPPRERLRLGMKLFARMAARLASDGFDVLKAKTGIARFGARLVDQVGFVRLTDPHFLFRLR